MDFKICQIYTRKQMWRRCISNQREKKKYNVKFNNIVTVILIPTRHELNNLYKFYESYLEFI